MSNFRKWLKLEEANGRDKEFYANNRRNQEEVQGYSLGYNHPDNVSREDFLRYIGEARKRNNTYLGAESGSGLDWHYSHQFDEHSKDDDDSLDFTSPVKRSNTAKKATDGNNARPSNLYQAALGAFSTFSPVVGNKSGFTPENNTHYAQMDPALAEEALMGFYATHPQDYTTNLPYTTVGKDRLTELAQQLRVSQQENEGSIARQRQKALEEEAARRQAWFNERADKYSNIPLKDDFEQNISGWEDVGKANDQLMTEAARGYELTVPLENRDADTQNALKQQEADSSYNVSRMSPTERKVYRYLQNTEGDDAAKDYMDYLSYRLNARNMNEVRAAAERGTETTGGKWVHSALSVPANLAGGALGAADYAIQNVRSKFSYRPIDYNSGGQIPGEYASAVRENTQEDMGSVGKFVYGTAMSMADSAASMLTIGKGGGALLGLSAGRQGVKDAIDAGATDSQAIAMGLFNGAAEMIFENIGIDNLYSILESGGTRTFKAAVKSILGQALSEGTEEVGTTLANTWGDAVIMADKSEINRMIDGYMSEGASREQATRAAWLNWAQNLGMDFLGGLTSGALFGIGGTIIANAKNDSEIGRAFKQNGAPNGMRIEDAISEVTNVPNLYSNSTDTLALYIRESGIENVSDRTLGRFYRLFTQDQQNLQQSGINDFEIAEYVERGMEPYQEPRPNAESSIARDEAGNVDVEQTLRNAAQETTAMEVSRENEQSDANTRRAWEDALPASQQNTEVSNQNMPVTAQENAQERSVTSPEESVMQAQKTPQAAENGVQAAYVKGGRISDAEMSGSGAAKNNVQLANGETAQVQNISVSDNGVVLETSRGKALADDVQIDDPSLYTIVSAAEKYDTQGAQALFRGYENSDLSAQNYVRAFESAYESGHVGLDYGTFLEKGGYATFLDKDTRMAAYAAGQRVFTSDKETASVRGGVVEKFTGELTREQRAAVNALNAYGRAIGRTINIVDSIDVKKKDGSVRKSGANATFNPKTNEYTIALDAQGQAYVAVALHESVHDVAANQPQMYDMLHTTVMEYLKMEGEDIDTLRAEWRDRIGDMSDERIDEEIVGNTVPVILSDKETAQDFAERFLDSDEKKSAFRRLIDSILDFLKRAYDKLKNLKSWRTMKTLEGNIQAVQDIREVMFDALDELRNGDVGQNQSTDAQERMSSNSDEKYDTKGVHWALARNVMSLSEARLIWEAVDNITSRDYVYRKTAQGEYIIESEDALFFVRADAHEPYLDRIIRFSDGYWASIGFGKEEIANASNSDLEIREALSFLKEVYGEGFANEYQASDERTDGRKAGRGKRASRGEVYRADGRGKNHAGNETGSESGTLKRYSARDYGEVKDQFDGDGDVEQTRDLIAVHNLSADQLMKTLELEGFPMPSIAVIRANAGHSRYGDISVIFDKATIDPAQSRRNKIYGGDAWTPTFPGIEYEASSKLVEQIRDKYYAIPADARREAARPLYRLYSDAESFLDRYGGEKGLIEHYADDTDMMQAYLADSGKTPVATIQKQTVTRLDADEIKLYDHLADKLGKDAFLDMRPKNGESPMTARRAWIGQYAEQLKEAFVSYYTDVMHVSKKDAQTIVDKLPVVRMVSDAVKARNYLTNGAEKITTEPDVEATHAAIRKAVDRKAYESWLHGLLDGIEKGRGIRNNKEAYTASGNLRSFKSLHYEVSLENIVRAMMEGTEKGGAMFSATGLFGLATKDYGSIDQVRADKSRLAQLDDTEYSKMKQDFQDRFTDIAASIMDKSTDNDFIAMDDAANALLEAVRQGKTQAGMRRVLNEYNHLNIQPDTAKQLYDLVQEIAQMPTEYFEAKPQRAVGLEEIAYVVLPDNADAQLKTALDERNIPTLEYKAGDEADRARVLNGEETKNVRFSLQDTSSVDIATVEKENAQLREANEELRKQFKRTVGVQLDQKSIRKIARDLIKQYDSSYSLDTLTDNLSKVFDVVANGGLTWDEASSAVVDMCRKVLEESSSFDAELYDYDQPVREYLKNVRLEISDDMRGGIELVADNGAAYRRGLFGIVGTAKKGSGVSIDQMWREASEIFPTYFSEDIVNAEDQAERLYHLAQRLKKSSYFVNAFAQNIDAAAYDMMLQIGAKYPGIPHTQTFADKFAAKVNEARAKTKKAYDAKLAQLRAQQKTTNRTVRRLDAKATKIANRMLQQQARYESQLESQNKKIERMEAARDKSKDTARRKKYRDRISKNAAALYQWLAKPTDKAHVPENIRAAVTQLVRAIDLSSGTKYGEAWRQRLSALADQFDKSTLDAAYQSFANSIDPDLTTDIRAFVDSQTGVTVSDMDADHLQTLSELLNRVKKAVTEANKFHAAERSRTVQEVAIKTREEFNRKRVFSETKSGKAVQAIIDFNQADAVTLFHYLGKEAETIYNAVRQGFDEYVFHVRDAQQYAVNVLEKAGDKKQYSKTHKFHVDGKDIELSVAQIMTLYELSQRPQAAEHLYDGGIVLIKRSATGTQKEKTHVRVTKQDVSDMIAVLTDSQKTTADALQRFLQEDSAAWGNDATMTVYGYRKFGEDHYFPIDSDRDFISTSGKDSSNNGDLYALRNWRSSKSTVEGASNPLIVGDIFDVWTKHVSEMAKYGAYLAPMDDMLKWYNWRGRDGSGRQISVRESLNGAFGKKDAAKFVETFIKNINGSGRIDVAAQDKIFDTMVRNAKAAAVGANLSVAIQQPTAYARAYAEIDAKYLALAFAQKPNMQLAQQYCPIAQWKAWGFFDVNVGPNLKSVILGDKTWLEKIREVQMALPELGDNVTWGYIWNACALEVADKENVPPDQRNTEEFYQKVGRRMSEVIDKTQVVDSPFTRSFISSNKGYQAFTAFQNEPMKSYNMLTRAAYDNVYEHTKETKKHLRRSNVAFVAASVFAAMGKAIISALRRNDDKKGDSWAEKALIRLGMTEEGRYTYGQKWMVSALEETADNLNPLNTHWLTSAIVEMIERAVFGTNYSSGRIDEKTISSIEDFAKLIKKLTEGKDVETYRLVYKGAEMVSYLTGIGFQSLLKDFKGIANAVSDAISPDYTPTMNDAFILIERGDVGSVEIAATLEATANEILAKTPSISEEKAMQQAESDLRSKVTNRYKDDYINAFEKGYTQKAKQIAEWMYATGLYEDRDAVDDVVRGWLVDHYKDAYLAAKTDAERSNIFEKLYATKKWRNRAELKKAIRGWTEAKD